MAKESHENNGILPIASSNFTKEMLEAMLDSIDKTMDVFHELGSKSEEGTVILEQLQKMYLGTLKALDIQPDTPLEQVKVLSKAIKDIRGMAKKSLFVEGTEELNNIADSYEDQENGIMEKWADRVNL